MFRLSIALALLSAPVMAQLRIHEIVYDGIGTDADEVFIELTGPGGLLLDGWMLEGVNGGSGAVYRSISLDGFLVPADGVLVLATDQAVGNTLAARDITASVDWQNGPDAVRLIDPTGSIADAVQYGDAGAFNSGEGAFAATTGSGESLSRDSLGTDTQDNAHDFSVSVPTPGEAIVSFPAGATLSLPDTLGQPGQLLELPLRVTDNEWGLLAAEVAIVYDAQLLTLVAVASASMTSGWQVASHVLQGEDWQDTLRVALATDIDTLLGDGALLNLTFQIHDDPRPGTAALRLIDPVLGDGTTAPSVLNGSLQRIGTGAQLLADTSGFALPHRLTVGVDDVDEDRTDFPDTVTITVSEGDTTESLRLAEDANHGGRFRGVIDLLHAPQVAADGRLQVLPRQPLNLCYTDSLDGHGSTADLCVDRSARGHDAVLQVSKVIEPGDTLWLRVRDRDLNRDSSFAEHGMVTLQVGDSTIDYWLDAVDPALAFYDGTMSTSSTTTGIETLHVVPGDWVIVSYLDTAAAAGDLIIRSDTSIVIERFGDADGNGLLQAFDANVILRHVVQPALNGADSLAANVDSLAPMSAVTPLDAAMLLQQRVGLLSRFPIQLRSSINHPGPHLGETVAARRVSSSSSARIATRASLRAEGEDLLLWLDDLGGTIAAEVEIRNLQAQDVEAAPSGFLAAHRRLGDNWHVALAGAMPLTGSGPLLRFRKAAKSPDTTVERIRINDEAIAVHTERVTSPMPSRWRMDANHPNPFNGSTLIPLILADQAHVDVVIHNLLGQQVRRLLNQSLQGGEHLLRWDGLNDDGLQLATGVYIIRVRLAGTERRQRIMLLR